MRVARKLAQLYPDAECALVHDSPLELLIATILSAQCTDERVNIVTKELFQRYRKAEDFARAPLPQLEKAVKSTGFFRNKAKNIKACCQQLVEHHGGEVPRDIDSLVVLPGVGRKTANVVLGTAFGIPSGVVVDTHVTRLSNRLGLTASKDAVKIEQDLVRRPAGERVDRVQPPDDPARPARVHRALAAMRRLRAGGYLSAHRRRGAGGFAQRGRPSSDDQGCKIRGAKRTKAMAPLKTAKSKKVARSARRTAKAT